MSHAAADFSGTDRFRIVRRLGAGAFGVVYEALDTERDQRVALKTLRWEDPAAIYRLKKEFRALADVVHRNLVTLYELFVEGESWFYTMELVEGVEFTLYVRPDGINVNRLRAAIRQLVAGVATIHASGMLHRDLKPSNVLVTADGRVVILDFGIVRELPSAQGMMETMEEGVFGTAAYMAPEQAVADAVEASDWYAVGTMLYEALSGELPFRGSTFNVLLAKQTQDPPWPAASSHALPSDLVALGQRLLARDAAMRPSRTELLDAFGVAADEPSRRAASDATRVLAGREPQMAALYHALDDVSGGGTASVIVTGVSGIGKTALVQRFLESLSAPTKAVVLTGRCYVRESVPYKGIDGIIDSLSRFLRTLTPKEADELLTGDVASLVRLFPVLARVDAISDRSVGAPEALDPVELRRRAFAALRALFARLSRRWSLILWIDDFQWTDSDSLALLDDALAAPDAPALLFIATVRREAMAERTPLSSWIERARTRGVRQLDLEPIATAVAADLAYALLRGHVSDAMRFAESIAAEAGGNPFLVEQLARFTVSSAGQTAAKGLALGEMLATRMGHLPDGARELFEVVATAGRPISVRTAGVAAHLPGDVRPLIAALNAEHFLRPTSVTDHVEPYHDRLREACTAALSPDRISTLHLRLALVMELQESDDAEALYEHFAAAGRSSDASRYAALAAQRAAQGLAFERAAVLYRRAIDLRNTMDSAGAADSFTLRLGLADALANAGRGADAANAYLAAAELAGPDDVVDLQRRAAEELLRSGHIDRGLVLLDGVFRHVGLTLATSPRQALLRLLWRRIRLRIRGLRFRERDASTLDAATRRRLDVCWGVAIGLARVDTFRAADIQSLNLLLSLKAGEPYRIARALAAEEGFLSTAGQSARARVARLERVTADLAGRIQHPHASGMAQFAAGVARFYVGDFAGALERSESAEALFREQCTGAIWEINTVQTYSLGSLIYLGQWRELLRRVPIRLREARERGDLYATADVAAGRPIIAWLIADDLEGARAVYRDVMDRWSPSGFHTQHLYGLMAHGNIDLYAGNGPGAWERISERWNAIGRSMLMRIQLLRIEAQHLRARCALASISSGGATEPHLRAAEHDARRILAERCAWSDPLAWLILAGVNSHRRRHVDATTNARAAYEGFTSAGMDAYAAIARRRYGLLLGGAGGATEVAAGEAWLRDQGVVDVTRMCATLDPGGPA